MKTQSYDLIVIGGGPVGVSGATFAGLMGRRVALIEKNPNIGGAGIDTGTVPSKTLRETALALSGWRSRRLFGVDLSLRREATVADFMHHTEQVTSSERNRLEARLAETGVETFFGNGRFSDPYTIHVTSRDGSEILLHGEKILIATGSSPVRPAEFPFEDDRVHDSDEILKLKELPKTLAVVGAGVIGSEYACTFAAIGAHVHLIDGRDTFLPFLDSEISEALSSAMTADGIVLHRKERVTRCDNSQPGKVLLTLTSGITIACDGVLIGAGRNSNTEQLNLGAAGLIPGKRGLLAVDAQFRTPVPHIFAAGDVIGAPALAATGVEQARIAVAHAFGSGLKPDLASVLPTGIYTIPEISMAGETEESLRQQGVDFIVGRARYANNPRGKIIGDNAGLLKLIFRREDMRLVGVHIIGEQATELVHIGLVALMTRSDADLFNRACFNYPTLGDLYKYATYDALLKSEHLQTAAAEN